VKSCPEHFGNLRNFGIVREVAEGCEDRLIKAVREVVEDSVKDSVSKTTTSRTEIPYQLTAFWNMVCDSRFFRP